MLEEDNWFLQMRSGYFAPRSLLSVFGDHCNDASEWLAGAVLSSEDPVRIPEGFANQSIPHRQALLSPKRAPKVA